MKIPKKKELLKLQEKHRTDKKIGEALGGVPAHLVAYWRKKKKITDCDLLKYSFRQVKTLWETYGSDKESAAQLGITPAAFYKWRQKYQLKEKPRQLKINHLQLNLFAGDKSALRGPGLTLSQKIVNLKSDQSGALAKDNYQLEPDLIVLSSDWEKLLEDCQNLGLSRVRKPDRIWGVVSGDVSLEHRTWIKEFLRQHQIKNLLSPQDGEYLQILWERSQIPTLGFAVGQEKSIMGAGFLGTWGWRAESRDLVQLLESGKVALGPPESVQITLSGMPGPAIFASDIYSFLKNQIEPALIQDKVLEFTGPALSHLSLSQRMALALHFSLTPLKGILFELDQTVRKYSLSRLKKSVPLTSGDPSADYALKLEFDLSLLEPQLGFAPVNKIASVRQEKKKAVWQIVIGAGWHGRLEDFEIASRILEGKKIHPRVQLWLVPSSRGVLLSALKKGYLRTLLEAGGILCDPGISHWENQLDLGMPILSTCNLNTNHAGLFQSQEIIYSSPATAAASALKGEITDPRDYL